MKVLIQNAVNHIRKLTDFSPQIAVVLGSGLGAFADQITMEASIDYSEIPGFPVSTVKGHKGRLVLGNYGGRKIAVMQGRFHYYEGYSLSEVIFPIRVLRFLGASDLLITNASGGLNRNYRVGDLMVMSDHINMMGDNPLRGKNDDSIGTRFPPMQGAYTNDLINKAIEIGRKIGAPVQKGVYVAVPGPSYETAAELRALRLLGADAVGMSTVPEVIAANHCGYKRIAGISCITDMATGEGAEDVNHEMVVAAAAQAQPAFLGLIRGLIEYL
ncbi:MAG: purine-nucleoside phosphorylase [Candidatus Riflebacteria bacterium]|nr:purine-nucleoside phosphorylase [Candidatus Riflebacteria bacterium]